MRARLILAFTSFLDGLCARGVVVFLSLFITIARRAGNFRFWLSVVLSLLFSLPEGQALVYARM
jgi:hypothetical protein